MSDTATNWGDGLMANLYVIGVHNGNARFHVLSWTCAASPKVAWDQFIEWWGKHCEATERADVIRELKRKEGAECRRVPIDCARVH